MVVEKIGIEFSNLNNISPLNVSIPNTVDGFINNIPEVSNELTGGYLGLIVLVALFIYLLINFSDKTEYGFFRYSPIRAIGIASGVCGVMGVMMVNIGYFTEYFHVVIFMVISMVCTIWVYIEER